MCAMVSQRNEDRTALEHSWWDSITPYGLGPWETKKRWKEAHEQLVDAVRPQFVIETRSADSEQLCCFQSVSRRLR